MRLAIIGAGVGGCSAAFFAKRLVPSCEITVYERSDRVGGRIYGVDVEDQRVEIGAAFFKNNHQLLIGLLEEVGIEAAPIRKPSSIGVWNGQKFIVKIGNPALSALRLFLQNPLNILRLYWILREADSRSRIIYREIQDHPREWDELFKAAGIMEWLQRPLREVLLEKGVGSSFIDNMLEPMTRVIYNQDSSINTYAGLVTINILSGGTYNIPSGNEVLPKRLLEASGAALKLGVEVESVAKGEDGLYEVSGGDLSEKFDSVIIANHSVCNIGGDTRVPMECSSKKFQRVYVQIVRGHLNGSYFNLKPRQSPPDTIVTTRDVPFTHIIRLDSEREHQVYSIASTAPIENYLGDIFVEPEVVFRHAWNKAYPVLEPIRGIPRCRLDNRLFYTGCSESAVSAMEASILSAFNTVRLLGKELDSS
jgi:hypothetical protein